MDVQQVLIFAALGAYVWIAIKIGDAAQKEGRSKGLALACGLATPDAGVGHRNVSALKPLQSVGRLPHPDRHR